LTDEEEQSPTINQQHPDELMIIDPIDTNTIIETPNTNLPIGEQTSNASSENFIFSLYAITDQPSPKTLRFQASNKGHTISILIGFGISHNILQPRLPITPITSFSIMVGYRA